MTPTYRMVLSEMIIYLTIFHRKLQGNLKDFPCLHLLLSVLEWL